MTCSCSYRCQSYSQMGRKEILGSFPFLHCKELLGECRHCEKAFLAPCSFQELSFLLCCAPLHTCLGKSLLAEEEPPVVSCSAWAFLLCRHVGCWTCLPVMHFLETMAQASLSVPLCSSCTCIVLFFFPPTISIFCIYVFMIYPIHLRDF